MKYFVVSDIHGFYQPLVKALSEAGYQKDNLNHTLIVLGDIFDRGREPLLVYSFLKSIPEERLILIRGNHEDFFVTAVEEGLNDVVDVENGTALTIADILGVTFNSLGKYVDKPVTPMLKNEVYKFIKSNKWRQYIEIGNYILTHSYIPTINGKYDPSWRTMPKYSLEWDWAHFVNADKEMERHSFDEEIKKGKILVSGHNASSYLHRVYEGKKDDYSIFYGKNYICIDASVYHSGKINVFTFEA